MKVIGTAGHIDHGKSSLVRRLTGIDPDRLSEEKRRGMTIDLGFAWLTLPSGTVVSIVDVPGHERFIKNMVAGAGGVDVAVLVIAADESVMPQTREHLDILDLLAVRAGVIALTKADTVDEDWIELVREDARRLVRGTGLADSEIVAVSATSGRGIADLLDALDRAVALTPDAVDRGRPFVPIDRVFTVSGFGTVATGTLHHGKLAEGAEVEIMPRGQRARVRALQTHREQVPVAEPGSRVAVNLGGIGRSDAQRGDVIAAPGAVHAVRRFDARVRVLSSSPLPLRHGMELAVHVGAFETTGVVSIIGGDEIAPGEEGWVQLRFPRALAVVKEQQFVMRLPAPARTVAGGTIVDPRPHHRRFNPRAVVRLQQLASGAMPTEIRSALEGDRPRSPADIAALLGYADEAIMPILNSLEADGMAVRLGTRWLAIAAWKALTDRAVQVLTEYHAENPLSTGVSKAELQSRLGWRFGDWQNVLAALVKAGLIADHGALVALPGHSGGSAGRPFDVQRVLDVLARAPYSPVTGAELLSETGADKGLLMAMEREGQIVKIAEGLYLNRSAYDAMLRHTLGTIRSSGGVTVAALRDAFGTSRKYALAFLEHLDDERITQRQGDNRVLGSKAPECV